MKPWRYLQICIGQYNSRRWFKVERWTDDIESDGRWYPIWTLWAGPVQVRWLQYSPEVVA